jgi:hypothetical protein
MRSENTKNSFQAGLLVVLSAIITIFLWIFSPVISLKIIKYFTENKMIDVKDVKSAVTLFDSFGSSGTLFSGLAFIGIVYTIYLQQKQIKNAEIEFRNSLFESKKSRDAEMFFEIFRIMYDNQHKLRELNNLSNDFEKWGIAEYTTAHEVTFIFEEIAHLCVDKLFSREIFIKQYGSQYCNVWEKLRPYISELRKLRGSDQCSNFEVIVNESKAI